jgi:hypothetical protein
MQGRMPRIFLQNPEVLFCNSFNRRGEFLKTFPETA